MSRAERNRLIALLIFSATCNTVGILLVVCGVR